MIKLNCRKLGICACLLGLAASVYFSTFLIRTELLFSMFDGKSTEASYLFGIKTTEKPTNFEISILADRLNLLRKTKAKHQFRLDKKNIFVGKYYYSELQSSYFDAVNFAKMIESGKLDNEELKVATAQFVKNWNRLAEYPE